MCELRENERELYDADVREADVRHLRESEQKVRRRHYSLGAGREHGGHRPHRATHSHETGQGRRRLFYARTLLLETIFLFYVLTI